MQADLQDKPKRAPTRDRILEAAEQLFAAYGYDGVSLRLIGAESDAQIALINYHFGTKDMLYRAVFENRINPISERRRESLALALSAPGQVPSLVAILDAFARPWIEMRHTEAGRHYTRLIAREVNDPQEQERGIVAGLLDPIALDFIAAMKRALPDHDRVEIHWAYHVFLGALLLVLANTERVRRLSGDILDDHTDDAVVSRLVSFVVHALGANPRRAAPTRSRRRQ